MLRRLLLSLMIVLTAVCLWRIGWSVPVAGASADLGRQDMNTQVEVN